MRAERNLLAGVVKLVDASIEKTKQLATDVKWHQMDQADREKGNSIKTQAVSPTIGMKESLAVHSYSL